MSSTYWVTTASDSGAGSLRQAISEANASPGADIIDFNISGSGTERIALLSALPKITDAVTIDATTEPSYAGRPVIWLDGSALTTPGNGLTVLAGNSVIRGLAISGFNTEAAIELDGPGGDVIQGNYLGINPDALPASPNNFYGIVVASDGNLLGGTAAGDGNVISGNDVSGVIIQGRSNQVLGNFIGVDPAGATALSNGGNGIEVGAPDGSAPASAVIQGNVISANGARAITFSQQFAASNVSDNLIGVDITGTLALSNMGDGVYIGPSDPSSPGVTVRDNVISGNFGDGVRLDGASNAVVAGNKIGTDASGMDGTDATGSPLGNYGDGVNILGPAVGNTVGGLGAGDLNVIAGNYGDGVAVHGGSGNLIEGNYIGTDIGGSIALPNQGNGVNLQGSSNSVLGNVISGNMGVGVQIGYPGSPADFNVVQSNRIGTGADGAIAIPNQTDGVSIDGSGNLIGGSIAGDGNVIAFDLGNGVTVDSGTGNTIRGNSIYSNVSAYDGYPGIGIDLGYDGVTLNDSMGHDGPNLYQDFPVLQSALQDGTNLTVQGTLTAAPSQSFTVEFFGNESPDGSGYGQGQTFLGSVVVTTDATGVATFITTLTGLPAGENLLTATATDVAGNTSEFSADIGFTPAPVKTVPTDASLSGYVYSDANNDGVMEPGETGIAGATVTLSGVNDLGAIATVTATTAADGSYSFGNLRPGTYTITETQPASYLDGKDAVGSLGGTVGNDVLSTIQVAASAGGVNYNFGELVPAVLSGFVYNDSSDNNGIKEAGEPGIAGATVTLTGANDLGAIAAMTATTAADGSYSFGNLRPGTYTVTETQPSGYLDGKDAKGGVVISGSSTVDVIGAVALSASQTASNNNFGELVPSVLSGFVYNDSSNNNGVKESGEPGIAGATVTLSGVNDLGAIATVTATTAADGSYSFGNLRPGTYTITETQPASYLDGKDAVGSLGGTVGNDVLSTIQVAASAGGVNYNFGELVPAVLSGFVYNDSSDNNGIKESGEPGIAGATVTLSGVNDLGAIATVTATTAADGSYSFGNLRPGTYTVSEAQPSGYLNGKDTVGNLGGTVGNDVLSTIQVAASAGGVNYNFGELVPAVLSGFVYNDSSNNNGIKESGEPGIAGATVTLSGVNDLGAIATLTATTAADGSYSFGNLRPGTYTITETQPASYLDGKDAVGSLGGTVGNDVLSTIQVAASAGGVNYNFGELVPAVLSGFVYNDSSNNNGIKESGEPGIGGATVALTGANDLGAIAAVTTVTAADGSYSFGNLRPGTYTITEIQLSGYLDGKDAVGSLGGTVGNDVVSTIQVAASAGGVNYNFGELVPAVLSGFVYNDSSNNNGIKESGEPGIAGATVKLSGANDLGAITTLTATTAADGSYSFGNLRPGTYTVTETTPSGYLDGKDSIGTQGGTVGNDVFSNIVMSAGVVGTNNNFAELKNIIAGHTYRDMSGNGMTSDDIVMPGVTISLYLDRDGNATLDAGDGAPVATMVSDSTGAYSFGNMAPGQYFALETVPSGYVRTYPLFADYYSANLTNTPGGTSYDFDNYKQCIGTVTNITYTIDGTKTVTDLRGQTQQGDTVTVNFTVSGTDSTHVTFVVYNAPGATYDANVASQQTIYQQVGGTYAPGTYSLTVTLPQNYYQVDFVKCVAIDKFGPAGSNIFYSAEGRLISADNEGTNAVGQPVPSSLSGFVWVDLNDDGQIDFNEKAISGVTIQLTGTTSSGAAVSMTDVTDSNGYYQFAGLLSGTYKIHEVQPAGYLDGQDTLGTAGGTVTNDLFSAINLAAGIDGINYNFGEQPPTIGAVTCGETATIGFWNNKNGQALLNSLNGSSTSKQLGNWLAATCPNLFSSLKGLTNAQVAAYYQSVFKVTGQKLNAQVLSVAFAAYASSSQLAGTVAASYGFKVTTYGVGDATFNVGSSGAAFGVANNVTMSVIDLLHATDALSLNGNLYNGNITLDNLANTVYSNINQTGDIS